MISITEENELLKMRVEELEEALKGRATELGFLRRTRARVRELEAAASRRTSAYDQGYREASEALDRARLRGMKVWHVSPWNKDEEIHMEVGPRSAYGRVMELKT